MDIFNILAQIPFIAAFIWYFDRQSRQFQEFLREERGSREKAASEERMARQHFEEKIVDQFDTLGNKFDKHSEDFNKAVAVMQTKTGVTKTTRRPE